MLKNLLAVIFILSISVQATLSWGESYTFRNTRWGMSVEDVIAAESKLDPIEKSEHRIIYKTQVLGKNVELHYQFVQNKLIGSSYKLDDNYLNSKHFLDSYRKFKAGLTQKYGPAQKESTNWQNDALRNISSKRGLALSLGHVEYLASWETPDTKISCILKEDNYYVLCSVNYWSREFSVLQKVPQKEEVLDPL